MRTLSATLSAAQKSLSYDPLWKVTLTRAGETTRTYTRSRILEINHSERPETQSAEIVLNNSDGVLTSLDFENYQCVISYGINTSAGEEYSDCAPLRVRAQELHSGMGILKCHLRCVGLIDQLKEDNATQNYNQESTNTTTVKGLITTIASATLAPFMSYPAVTVTYDSEDSIIDSYQPKDYFAVTLNESRWDKISELINYTGCKIRPEDDGELHVLDPVISGTTYHYEYKFDVAGDHNFFAKTVRLRFVSPNREIVKSSDDHSPTYYGSATSGTSYAFAPKVHTTQRRLTSDAEALSIANAIIERYELDAEKGFVTVPMNVGQELWDYVKVTDSRQGDTRIGNVQFIQRNVRVRQRGLTFSMMIAFGKVTEQSIILANASPSSESGGVSNQQILSLFDAVYDKLQEIADAHNELRQYVIERSEVMPKLHVTDQLIIPVI